MTDQLLDGGLVVAGVDIGGTFTDCVIHASDGRVAYGKALSSPEDGFESGFFNSLLAAGTQIGLNSLEEVLATVSMISHGSTVATNMVVEKRGATVGLLTTAGFEDTLLMMRGEGRMVGEPPEHTFDFITARKPPSLVTASNIRGVDERIDSLGNVVVPLGEPAVEQQIRELLDEGCDAIAVALLWSIANPDHERRIRAIVERLAPKVFVTVSHEISRAVGEYERTLASVINAFVGPETSNYLRNIERRLIEAKLPDGLMLMQAHGGMVPLERSVQTPIWTIGSGPVGGLVATQRLANELGINDVIATDMGGTSFDVGIVKDGELQTAEQTVLGKYRYSIPSVEVISIDAGGGSIAWYDEAAGTMRLGPESAGSRPGPACYGLGGVAPTVTDANLVLGYLDPDVVFGTFSDRSIRPSTELAKAAIRTLADPLGLSVTDAALGIVEIANAKMANLLENVVVGRGFDPRDFTIAAYGGSGPLHAAGFARELGASKVLVPGTVSAVWSAFGVGVSDVRFQTDLDVALLEPFDEAALTEAFAELDRAVPRSELARYGGSLSVRRVLRLRYQWQRNSIEVVLGDGEITAEALAAAASTFQERYEARYSSAALLPDARLEIVSLRLEAVAQVSSATLSKRLDRTNGGGRKKSSRLVHFARGEAPVEAQIVHGPALTAGDVVRGPAVVDLPTTGIVVPADTTVARTEHGDFLLTFDKGAE